MKAEFNFEWIFAIVAGAMIFILAVYAASKLGGTLQYQSSTELSKEISIILDPMQAGFADGSSSLIRFNQETKINNFCEDGDFGTNKISTSIKKGDSFSEPSGEIEISNKYIFSDDFSGKEYSVLSKQLSIGFKITDIIFMTSKNYCFMNAPDEIAFDIKTFNRPNIKTNNCSSEDLKVCFELESNRASFLRKKNNCTIVVWGSCESCDNPFYEGKINKQNKEIYYVDSLLYPALISDYDIYECNVKRIVYRMKMLAKLYLEQSEAMNLRRCANTLQPRLQSLIELSESYYKLSDLHKISSLAREINREGRNEACSIW